MEKVVFLDRSTLEANVRRPSFEHEWAEYETSTEDEALGRLKDATIAITNKVPLKPATLERLPNLRMIAVAATGTDNVDVAYCRNRGIAVANIRNYAVHAVPEHVFALILALRRNLIAYREDVRKGLWQQSAQFCLFTHPMRDIHGSTLGVVGGGVLGRATAKLGEALGMKVLFADHKGGETVRPGYTAFETVLKESDVVSLHCPLTDSTRNLIGTAELMMMRPTAILINTARGGLVDEAALEYALTRGIIAGAGFDVLTVEPPRDGNRLLDINLPNFILTPHVAWASREAMQTLADQLIDNIEAFVSGKPSNLVT